MIGGACVMPSLNRLNPAVTGNLVITKTDFIFGGHAFVKIFDPLNVTLYSPCIVIQGIHKIMVRFQW